MVAVLVHSSATFAQERVPDVAPPLDVPGAAARDGSARDGGDVQRGFHPALWLAVRALADESIHLAQLQLKMRDGDDSAEKQLAEEALAVVPPSLREAAKSTGIDVESSVEMLLAHRGTKLVASLVESSTPTGHPVTCDDLLTVLRSEHLRELPSKQEAPEVADFIDEMTRRFGPPPGVCLWWPTVAYLAFGAIHTPSMWPSPEGEHRAAIEAFIQELLDAAVMEVDREAALRFVDIALTPPCERRPSECAVAGEDDPSKCFATAARGCLARWSGRVGFTVAHLAFVTERAAEIDRSGSLDGQRLSEFLSMMRLRILREIDPAALDSSSLMSPRYGNLAEAKAYFTALLREQGLKEFWAEARPDLEAVLAGRRAHPLDLQIEELREKLVGDVVASSQRRENQDELRRLEGERSTELFAFSNFLTATFVMNSETNVAFATLRELDRIAEGSMKDEGTEAGWSLLGERDPAWGLELVDAEMAGAEQFSYPAICAALRSFGRHGEDPAVQARVFDVATRGAPRERMTATQNAQLYPEEFARTLLEVTLHDLDELVTRAPDVRANKVEDDSMQYTALLIAAVDILRARKDDGWARDELRKTFDRNGRNLWRGGCPFTNDRGRGNYDTIEWIVETLGEKELQQLQNQGRLPERIRQVWKHEVPPVPKPIFR